MRKIITALFVLAIVACGGDSTTAPTPQPPAPPPPPVVMPPPPPPAPRPTTVSVTPSEVRLVVGDSVQLAAEVLDQNGAVMANVSVSWTSSNAAVATVSTVGWVKALSAGSANITATSGEASENASINVSLPPPVVAEIALDYRSNLSYMDTVTIEWMAIDQYGQIMSGVSVSQAPSQIQR